MAETLEKGIIPPIDAQRLEAWKRYKVLNTPSEASFNHTVRLMADTVDVPIARVDDIWVSSISKNTYFRSHPLCHTKI